MNSIVDLGKISKPATELIRQISKAIGTIYEPTHIRNVAKAKVDAKKISEIGKTELELIRIRAKARIHHEEIIQQKNIESIIEKSINHLSSSASPLNVDVDWLSYFFDKAKLISDQEMQDVWSKILADEANYPGNFRKRTLNILSQFEKNDATLFATLSQFTWECEKESAPIIWDYDLDIFKQNDISFPTLGHLEDIGLIKFNITTQYGFNNCENPFSIRYFQHSIALDTGKFLNGIFKTGIATYTKAGKELYRICAPDYNEEYFNSCLSKWKSEGLL